jgi:hypothetical protein
MMGTAGRAEWFDGCRRVTIIGDDDAPLVDGRIPGKNAVERLMRDIEERSQRRKVLPPMLLHMQYGALREMYGVKDLGDLLARGLPVVLDLPSLNPVVIEDAPAPSVADKSDPSPQNFAHVGKLLDDDTFASELRLILETSKPESLILEDARNNALPVSITDRLSLPSGRLVNNPNVAARGCLDNWRFATDQTTIVRDPKEIFRWLEIADREKGDLSYLADWWFNHPVRIERDLSQ